MNIASGSEAAETHRVRKIFPVSHYEGFREVSITAELFAEGNSILRLPPEPVEPLARPIVCMGQPAYGRETPMDPIELHIAKLSNVLVMPGKVMIDLNSGAILIDSYKYLTPHPSHTPGRAKDMTEEELQAIQARAIPIRGTTYAAACASNGFGHILLEYFSQYYWYEQVMAQVDRVLVNRTHGYFPEFFNAMGITDKMKVIQDRPYLCETLLVPRQSYILDRAISHKYINFMDHVGARLTETLSPSPAERIYVSRVAVGKRRLLGEERLEEFFSRKGFEIVRPEALTFSAQVNLFRNARIVAGCIGSALYNSIFCAPDVKRIILAPDRFYTRNDLMFGRKLTAPPYYFFGETLGADANEAMLADWKIDLPVLENEIGNLLKTF